MQLAFDRMARAQSRRFEFARFVPLIAIALVVALIAGIAYLLVNEDRALQRDALHRDTDTLAQSLSLRLQAISEATNALARDALSNDRAERRFLGAARDAMLAKPELVHVALVDKSARVVWSVASPGPLGEAVRAPNTQLTSERIVAAIDNAREAHSSFFSPTYDDPTGSAGPDNGGPFTDLVAPVFVDDLYMGAVLARVSLPELLRRSVAPDVALRYRVSLLTDAGNTLASTTASETPADALVYVVPIYLLPDGVMLETSAFRVRSPLLKSGLAWVVAGLTLAVLITLVALVRRDARQAKVERALRAETAFRRAMEDSLATGLAVIDRLGVLRHVNAAFCQMTGWQEADLVGHSAPFPYWPPGHFAEHRTSLNALLKGEAPSSGFELKVLRRDGSLFDARMYGSPLLSDDGEQLGWMIAMADITEPKRISEQLEAAHERFTTVLQSLDDAVSVVAPGTSAEQPEELLFANRGYRTLYGADALGHQRLQEALAAHGSGFAGEAYDGALKRWFDVRTREIRWVDGRDVRLQIATDISDRKATEEIVRQQQEKVALTSRLMTMGEMASSLAHELNQPLTTIAAYAQGLERRCAAGSANAGAVAEATHEIVAQTERADKVIRRVRAFARKRAAVREVRPLAATAREAIGLLATLLPSLPPVVVDDRLPPGTKVAADHLQLQQVLLNLMKNAADAMRELPVEEREITVVLERQDGSLAVAVADRGPPVPADTLSHLFEAFFTTKADGLGLGLAICKSIVEAHGGRLQFEPRDPPPGLVFRFNLPDSNRDG